jgi:hypothetical protein
VKCYNCNKKGHYSNDFPDKQPKRDKKKEKEKEKEKQKHTKEGMTATMMAEETSAYSHDNWEEFNFHQSNHKVNPAWILLSARQLLDNRHLLQQKTAHEHPIIAHDTQNTLQCGYQ